jgi:propanediol dehydratase small subunit
LVIASLLILVFVGFDPRLEYPLGLERPDLVTTAAGIPLAGLQLDDPALEAEELRATPATLRLQAEVAAASGRPQLAANLLRAAELAPLTDDTVLEIYTALRPGRSTGPELEAWAERLEQLEAPLTAAFVRDACDVYRERGLLAP